MTQKVFTLDVRKNYRSAKMNPIKIVNAGKKNVESNIQKLKRNKRDLKQPQNYLVKK